MKEENSYSSATAVQGSPIDSNTNPGYGWSVARAQKALLIAVMLQIAGIVPDIGWFFLSGRRRPVLLGGI